MSSERKVAVVGGGILGATVALRLAQEGHKVTLLERAPSFGGLAGTMDFGGHQVDRFYHVITPADGHMIGMAEELGLGDQMRFRPVGAGFWIDGELRDFNGVMDLLKFKPLSPIQRLRLGWYVAMCQVRKSFGRLDDMPLEKHLKRHAGKGVWNKIWKPLLDSRFERHPEGLPATYLWSRTRRMSTAREGGGNGEEFGHLIGGHQRLIDAIVTRGQELGVEARAGVPVEGLAMDDNGVVGVRVDGEVERYDLTISTLQPPALKFLLPEQLSSLLERYPKRWLGCVCLVLKVKKPLMPYYAVNIAEDTPITSAVETTQVLGTDHTDGLHLMYLPRYCAPDAPEQSEDDQSIYDRFTAQLARMSKDFRHEDVVDWTVQRAKLVEPVHGLGAGRTIPPIFPDVPGLALASNAQIYPYLLNGDSVIRFAEEVASQATERLRDGRTAPEPHEVAHV